MPSRVEREIEEILSKLDGGRPAGRPPTRLRRTWRSRLGRSISSWRQRLPGLPSINPGSMMLLGLCLILSALFLRLISPDLTRWVVIVGLVLFFASFVLSFRRGGGGSSLSSGDTYWRGQRIPRSALRGPSITDRLRGWWRQRNRRRW
jgi:hypothetical protein